MNYEIKRLEYNDGKSRKMDFIIDGRPRVTVYQLLCSPVDFRPRGPEISWSAPHLPDVSLTEATGQALIEAAKVCREWEAGVIQATDSFVGG